MPITVKCACGKQYPVKDEFAGQRVKCPDCGQVLTIPRGNGKAEELVTAEVPVEAEEVDEVAAAEEADDIVQAPPKKKGKGMVFALLGCGCLFVVLGGGLLAAAGGWVWYVGIDNISNGDFFASNTDSDKDKDKDKDKAVDPNKDKTVDPNKDKAIDPNKDKAIDPDKDKAVDPNKDKTVEPNKDKTVKPPPPVVEKGPWKGHAAAIRALRFTNDGKFAVTAAGELLQVGENKFDLGYDNTIRFWNVADGSEAKVLDLFKEGIGATAISPDGRYAAVAYLGQLKDGALVKGSDHVIHVWDLQAKRELSALRGHVDEVYCLAFKKNSAQLLSGGRDNKVILWNIRDGSMAHDPFLGHTGTITAVAFDPKNDRAVSCSADHTIRLWDLDADPNANALLHEFKDHQDIVWAAAFSDDGKNLVTAGGMQTGPGGYVDGAKDTDIRLWDVEIGKEIKVVKPFKGTGKAVTCLAFSHDGHRILSGGADNVVRVWSVATGQEMAKYEGHKDVVRFVAFFPNGKQALSGGDDKTLRVWTLPPGVPEIIANLGNPDLKVKQQAVQDLAKLGDEAKPAVPALIKCLNEGDAAYKQQVIGLLKQLGGAPGRDDVALLAKLLADKTFPDGRVFALDALTVLGADAKPALPQLAALLKENDAQLKRKAVVLIGIVGPEARKDVYKQFIDLLRDPDAETVKAVTEALPKLGKPTKEDLIALGGYLTDRNENVRKYALTALVELGPDAETELPRIVLMAKQDKSPELRKVALTAVLTLKPKEESTIELLKAALKDDDNGVCLHALAELAQIGPSGGALPALLDALDHKNDEVRKAAEDAFSKVTFEKSHVKALATVLRLTKSARVRAKIVDVLGKLGPNAADAAEDLGLVARDSEGELRLKAIQTLGELGPAGKKGGPRLVEVLADKNEKSDEVRIEVAIALTKIEAPEAKQAIPLLIRGLMVTDATDAKQLERQDKVAKILMQIGKPAADAMAKTLSVSGEFYVSNVSTPKGKLAAAARKKVIETLMAMGPKANTGQVLFQLAEVQKSDPDLDLRKLAGQARTEVQK